MKGVTTNGVKKASSIIDKLKFRTIYKNKDIHLIPETDKYDGVLIWLHGIQMDVNTFYPVFHGEKLLGVNLLYLFKLILEF